MLTDLTVKGFNEELASSSPAPGGGSVAALAGSLGASLASMVARLTVGREKFRESEKIMLEALQQGGWLKDRLISLVDEDTLAFNRVASGYKLPRNSEEEKEFRSQAIQEALKKAALLPLETARHCLSVMELGKAAVISGNPNALSDAGVAVLVAYAGLQGALLNVDINLKSIGDEVFKREIAEESEKILSAASVLSDEVRQLLKQLLE